MTKKDLHKLQTKERFQHLFAVISGERFLKKLGLGNEIPFFICPYPPEESTEMGQTQRQLIHHLAQKGIRVLDLNLYDLAIEILQRRGIWEQVLATEPEVSKGEFIELLQGVLDPEHHLVPAIAEKMAETEFDVLFLSGAGEVFPYIRSHSILNNLQSTAKNQPTVLFFPGTYTQNQESGNSLDLFGKFQSDKYYRAFNIYFCEP